MDKLAPFITTADFSVSMCKPDCACVYVYVCEPYSQDDIEV